MAKIFKKKLTAEITEYINSQLDISDDPEITTFYQSLPKTTESYFYNADSLRLRSTGNNLLSLYFEHEKFKLDKPLSSGEILLLAKNLNTPFFLDHKFITLYSGEHCVLFKLSGDVTSWLDNFR